MTQPHRYQILSLLFRSDRGKSLCGTWTQSWWRYQPGPSCSLYENTAQL